MLVSSTPTLPVNIFTWKKPYSPGATKMFVPRARIKLATRRILDRTFYTNHWTTGALALVKSEFYYISRVYYTSVLGAECTALLRSVLVWLLLVFSELLILKIHQWAAHIHFQWTFALGRRRNHTRPAKGALIRREALIWRRVLISFIIFSPQNDISLFLVYPNSSV